jgi:bacterioferritin-associated ferredoxin
MYICICNAVTEREIRGAVELGCTSIEDLGRDLGVAANCGKCLPDAKHVLQRCRTCPAASAAFAGGND